MKHFLLSLGLLLVCVTASFAQDKNVDVPRSDSTYADVALLSRTRGDFNVGDECYYSRPRSKAMTRYELAVATARLLRNLPSPSGSTSASAEEVLAAKRLVNEFRPELTFLGIPVDQIKINGVFLIEPSNTQPKLPVAPPFADVPRNHWDYEAVEALRQAGILVGIPAGDKALFNSPNTK